MLCIRAVQRRPSLLLGTFTGSAVSGSLIDGDHLISEAAWNDLADRGPASLMR